MLNRFAMTGNIRFRSERADRNSLGNNDHASGVGRDAFGRLRPLGIRGEGVKRIRTSDTDEVRTEVAGVSFDGFGIEIEDHGAGKLSYSASDNNSLSERMP